MYINIIECEDGSLYTGIAINIVHRLTEHYFQLKSSAKYTKSHKMVSLKALWRTDTRQNASKLEYRIKSLSRQTKLDLIAHPNQFDKIFCDYIPIELYSYIDKSTQDEITHQVLCYSN